MNKIEKFSISIYLLSFLLFNAEVSASHHRYEEFGMTCKNHRGIALIKPECMRYIYGDEAKYKIRKILKEYFKIKNYDSVLEKKKLIKNFVEENFNAESFAKRISGKYLFETKDIGMQNKFIVLMENLLIDLFFLNTKSNISYTYEVDNVPIVKDKIYNITTYISVSDNSKKKLKLVWMLERKFGKYNIIDIRFHNTNFSEFLKEKLNINNGNIKARNLITDTELYLSNFNKKINFKEKEFIFLMGKTHFYETNKTIKVTQDINQEKEYLLKEIDSLKEKLMVEKEKIALDLEPPKILITSSDIEDKKAIIKGNVSDNVNVAELIIGGELVMFDKRGNFNYSTFIPINGKEILIEVVDSKGLSNEKIIYLKRKKSDTKNSLKFSELNPLKLRGKKNKNALAIIIGVNNYLYAPNAKYADRDAIFFTDFSNSVLGIHKENIKTLSNTKANQTDIKKAIKIWLKGYNISKQSDIFIFYAGHGLASTDGQELYLLPYDGEPRLLEDTAILRSEIYDTIKSMQPKSVTVFLDACYSGLTRDKDMILADARPISIVPLESDVPENFTVFSASSGSEISGSLPEADHGLFSYFLMKGLEGEADSNNDKKITNGELHAYILSNVTRQATRLGREQTPQLQGDEDRVLVEFN